MSDIRDYIRWRGDLTFAQDPVNPVDALVFSALSYIHLDLKPEDKPRLLGDLAEEFLGQDDFEDKVRSRTDPELLLLAGESRRFGMCRVSHYTDLLIPEQETQFAAATFLLDDDSAMIAFRGTDSTVVGWKEDFNMSFQQTVPSQRLALNYVRHVASEYTGPLRICGHSKGGNMAVFAAARSSPMVQQQILAVYNNDGPGFSEYMMGDLGYKAMVPKIHTFVPQSSIIGMLMDHEEPYTIIKSHQLGGFLQHDVYNWEVIGPGFVLMEEITADSRFLNQTIRNWAASMDNEQRNKVVDAMFGILAQGNVEDANAIMHPRNIRAYVKILSADETLRKTIGTEFVSFLEAAKTTLTQIRQQKELEEPETVRKFLKKK